MNQMQYIKTIICLIAVLGMFLVLVLPAGAETYIYEGNTGGELDIAWENMLQELPDDIREEAEKLSPTNKAQEWQEYLGISYWLEKILTLLQEHFQNALNSLLSIGSILLVSSALRQWQGTHTEGLFQFCSDVCLAMTVFTSAWSLFDKMQAFLGQLCNVMTGMIPVMAAVSYGAGEIATASVNRMAMTLFITVLNQLQRWLFAPFGQALFRLSIVTAVCSQIQLGSFTAALKKLFMTLFTFMLLIYSFVYGIQNTLARSADSLGLRTVKFAMGSFIPIVGGTISDAFSAVREGLGYVRVMTGIGGIWILLLMVLPVAVSVWVFDLVLSCGHTAAELLGAAQGARLLGETRSILQILAALVWVSVTFFLFAIILFTKTAVHTG